MSERARTDLALMAKIEAIHRRSRGVYGSPNIHAELADDYRIRVGRKRVARLMRAAGLRGATLRRYVVTTEPDLQAPRAIDLVERQFYTDGPDRLWVADITYVPTWSGFLYLAMVLDMYSRRIVGWSMETHLRTELILAALNMAITQRQPSAVIHHSDPGCQYTSYAFGKRCREAGVMPSMGSVDDAYDNAMAESFFATLERELLSRRRFKTQALVLVEATLEAEQESVVARSRRIHYLVINQHGIHDAAYRDQLLPLAAVARESRYLARSDSADSPKANLNHHPLEAAARHSTGCRAAQVLIDNLDLGKTEIAQASLHRIL